MSSRKYCHCPKSSQAVRVSHHSFCAGQWIAKAHHAQSIRKVVK